MGLSMARNSFTGSMYNDDFEICNEYVSASFEYYGWQSKLYGSWKILRKDVAANEYRYVYGSTNYISDWSDITVIENLTYGLPYVAYNS